MSNSNSTSPFPLVKNNYLSKDYSTLRDELLAKLPLITKGNYTDLNESDPGIAILETFFSAVDNLMFYLDMQGQEMDINRARQRVNVIKLLRLIGYETRGVSASKGTITVQVAANSNPFFPVYFQSGVQASAQGPNGNIVFTTTEPITLVGPTDQKTIPIIQGVVSTDNFISDGTSEQRFILSGNNIDKTTVLVSIADTPNDLTSSESWTLVTSFYKSTFNDTHFRVEIDENANVTIIFGDGQFGKIPIQNSLITVKYIQSLGADGNVGKNAINKINSGVPLVQDVKGNKVNISIINSEATSGGADVETIEEAKVTAQGLLFGLNRALSRGDFEALMTSVPGVTKAISWGENEEQTPDYRMLNRVRVCFFAKDFSDMYYNSASRASYRSLRDNQVRALLTERMPITTRLSFVDPIFVDIFLSLQLAIDITKYDPNLVLDQVRFNILDYYSLDNVNFGQDVRISNILSLANAVTGVGWAKVTRLHTTPPLLTPDTAPLIPQDIVLEKWKLPTFSDTTISSISTETTSVTPPYVQIKTPISINLGQNDITIINPDSQSDIYLNGYTYFTGTDIQHISITYVSVVDEPQPSGGVYGHPNPETDVTTYSSLE